MVRDKMRKLESTMFRIQTQITVPLIRLKVTVSLYLKPNNRARSLSTLIAVRVNKDTALRLPPAISFMLTTVYQVCNRWCAMEIN